ncbi:MAG: acetoin dehydrogenase dihydrolipoyllysine-residue acetyltransferase subunit [Hyphomicrobiales bacterium]
MADSILCPQVGQDLTEAKVVALHVKLGDKVKKGDIVAEVESEKASFEVEAFSSGTVIALPYKVGDTATVLEPLVVLGKEGESVASEQKRQATAAPAAPASIAQPKKNEPSAPQALAPQTQAGVLRSSPLARRIASEAGLELSSVAGSGPYGAVVLRDVESALASGSARVKRGAVLKGHSSLTIKSLREGAGHPVVFIHGFGSDLSSWRPFVPKLAIGNPLIGIDLPGHGGSLAHAATGFEQMAADLTASLLAKGHKRVHLVGHSLGAALAAAVSERGDIDVRSLTLIAPAGLGPRIDGHFIEGFLDASTEAALTPWMKRLVHSPASLPQAYIRATLTAREENTLVSSQRAAARAVFEGSTQLFSIIDALRHYDGPCRAVIGRRDAIIPSDQADHVPGNVAINYLEHVGHLPQVEAAELVGRLVTETIRSAG